MKMFCFLCVFIGKICKIWYTKIETNEGAGMVYLFFAGYIALFIISMVLYLPKLFQIFSAHKKPTKKIAKAKRKIALVIPARNESKIIGDLFDSIKKQTYDRDFFDVHVLVKDPNDPTIEMAEDIGAEVFVCTTQKCKGDVLHDFFEKLLQGDIKKYEAFAIVDADAVLTENYLEELNNALEYDCDVFQTRKLIKNFLGDKNSRSFISNSSALIYPIVDDMSNTFKSTKNLPLNLCGQGLMIRRKVIEEKNGWHYKSLTEDYELRMDSVLHNFKAMYYPYAALYTEEVVTYKENIKRKMRWLVGRAQCDNLYGDKIKEKLKGEKPSLLLKFDLYYYSVAIFVFLISTVLMAIFGVLLTAYLITLGNLQWIASLCLLVIIPLLMPYLLLWCFSLIAMIHYRDAFSKITLQEKIATLFYSPFNLFEFAPLYLRASIVAKRQFEWTQTERVEYDKQKTVEK